MTTHLAHLAPRERVAWGAALGIGVVTTAWWGLALWPAGESAGWVVAARDVCFGVAGNGLPDAAGWTVLILQPVLMIGMLLVVYGTPLRSGAAVLWQHRRGRVLLRLGTGLALLGLGGVGHRLATAPSTDPFARFAADAALPPDTYPVLDRPAPPLGLVDQRGDTVELGALSGRPVLVTFAFGHCETVCPVVVHDARLARQRLGERAPALVVLTLDPWRDRPARLPHIAERFGMTGPDEYVLSGPIDHVNRVLDAWGIARSRDPSTGDITHPRLLYAVDGSGTMVYALNGGVEAIVELTSRL